MFKQMIFHIAAWWMIIKLVVLYSYIAYLRLPDGSVVWEKGQRSASGKKVNE